MSNATIFDVERCSFVDGPGLRTTVFFKGCNLKCMWCHNPESQSFKPEMLFYKDKCKGCGKCLDVCHTSGKCILCGKCELYCPADARKVCGKKYTVDEIFDAVISDKPFYDNSGGGVTFSGGECMLQIDFLCDILKKCKENGIHTAVDTAGHVPFESFERVLPYTDLFLYDIKCYDSEKHKKYTGVDNLLILENFKKLFKANAKIWIRIPVISGVNDNINEMESIKDYIYSIGIPEKVELLPYHSMGENKYRALNKIPINFFPPSEEKIKDLRKIFDI